MRKSNITNTITRGHMIKKIENKEEKKNICMEILEALPEWFEIPESRESF